MNTNTLLLESETQPWLLTNINLRSRTTRFFGATPNPAGTLAKSNEKNVENWGKEENPELWLRKRLELYLEEPMMDWKWRQVRRRNKKL